ncbi:hypothetical protein ACFSJU_03280 [Paradesertivirga mongoliensis]|uniref:Phosphatidate cytidylyltransferase n=1 Tax=Paradesertivirga mongoliensis TaxID=2100740 RepID=A0ABW4ZIE5_9SPHI|nr:hypothetical protein [Pedobacter mongoliensis]
MKNTLILTLAAFTVTLLSGCEAIADIFQAGIYVGIFIVVAIIAVIIWILRFFRRRT